MIHFLQTASNPLEDLQSLQSPDPLLNSPHPLSLQQQTLLHEVNAGQPCLKCEDKCPGLEIHFWRYVHWPCPDPFSPSPCFQKVWVFWWFSFTLMKFNKVILVNPFNFTQTDFLTLCLYYPPVQTNHPLPPPCSAPVADLLSPCPAF